MPIASQTTLLTRQGSYRKREVKTGNDSTANVTKKIKFLSSLFSSISPGFSDIKKYLHEISQRYSVYM